MEATTIFEVPDDALQNILLRLPLPDIVRLCCVCKRWDGLVQSLNMFRFNGFSWSKPYCIRVRKDCRELEVYDRGLERCHKLSLDFVSASYDKMSLLASGGGFLLLRADDGALIVCNPLTKVWRELPPLDPPPAFTNSRLLLNAREPYQGICICPPPGSTFSFFDPVDPGSQSPIFSTIFADPLSMSYCILIAGYKRDERASGVLGSTYDSMTRIYQFSTNTWTTGGMLPRKEFYGTGGVFCNGFFYSVVRIMWRRPTIIVYDWHKRAWSDLEIDLPSSILPPHLVEHHGDLLIVGACYGDNWRKYLRIGDKISAFSAAHTPVEVTQPSCIRIWQLVDKGKKWNEVTRMPKELYDDFVKQANGYYECVGKGDLIYFAKENGNGPELVYDLSCDKWKRFSGRDAGSGKNAEVQFRKEIHLFKPSVRVP
ncbi:hypothetical protein Mapa_017053 [Marchantia paleacea]|nr:hypothetical protein Mapa_017053 [Marchantia paleacea]